MPLSRARRQRATASPHSHVPKIDAFGTVHVLDAQYKARVVHYAPDRLAVFREVSPQAPTVLELSSAPHIKGRVMTATALVEGGEVEIRFQKAGCGCETPRNLRAGRNALLEAAGLS